MASTTIYDLLAKVAVDTTEGVKNLTGLHGKLDETAAHAGTATGGISGFIKAAIPLAAISAVGYAVAGAFQYVVGAASETEQIMTRTNSVLASTHGVSGQTRESIVALATSMLSLTGIDDEATQAAENTLLAYTHITTQFQGATTATADLATALADGAVPSMQQMTAAADIVGKALEQPDKAARSLRAAHIFLTAEQQKTIDGMVKAGNVAGAQGVILDILKTKYGGAAEAAGGTFAGQMAKLQNTIHNVAEAIGGIFLPILTQFISSMSPAVAAVAQFVEGLKTNEPALNAVKIAVIALSIMFGTILVGALIAVAAAAWAAAAPFLPFVAIALLVGAAIAGLVIGIKLLYDNFAPFREMVNAVGVALRIGLAAAMAFLAPLIEQAKNAIATFAGEIGSRALPIVKNLFLLIQVSLPVLRALWNAVWPALSAVLSGVWQTMRGIVQVAWSIISGIVKIGLDILGGNWRGAWNDMRAMLSGVWAGIQNIVRGAINTMIAIMRGGISLASGAMSALVNAAASALGALGGRLVALVRSAISNMIGAIRGMAGAVAGAFGSLFSGIKLPHFASGGYMPNTGMAVINEQGPGETVLLPGGSYVYPRGSGPSFSGARTNTLSASSSAPIYLNIHIAGQRVAQVLLPDMVNEIRRATGGRGT